MSHSRQLAELPGKRKTSLTEGMAPAVHISYQVTIVANLMAFGNSTRNFKQFGLNIREWRVIALIGQLGPLTASQIVEEIVQDKANISRAISRLDNLELVVKLPNPKHKRSPIIWMTKEGMNLYESIVPEFNHQATMFCASLTDTEEKTLCRLLDKLKVHSEYVRDREGL